MAQKLISDTKIGKRDSPIFKMIKISKNIEMTGERQRGYDVWRFSIPLEYISIPFLEYSRLRTNEWPFFNLHASIYPTQTSCESKPTEKDTEECLAKNKEFIDKFNQMATIVTAFTFFVVVMNKNREWFLVQQLPQVNPRDNTLPTLYSAKDFVEQILHQKWKPNSKEQAENPLGNSFKSYSAWHRWAMPSSALVMDIDYVEIREQKPVAIIEVTKSNTDDLAYGLFSFLSRGFAQASVLVQLGEYLNVNSYVLTYPNDMKSVELLLLNRDIIPKIDKVDRERQDIANQYLIEHGSNPENRRKSQGVAVSTLYSKIGGNLMTSLESNRMRMSIDNYKQWLHELKPKS